MNYFVVGDVHGCYEKLELLLNKYWNPDKERLILLGDLIDKGPDSLDCVLLAKRLHEEYGAVVLKGNHEELFHFWVQNHKEASFYWYDDLRNTVASFFDNPSAAFRYQKEYIAKYILDYFPEEMQFIAKRPLFCETPNFLFVHAGIDLKAENWKETAHKDCLWIRNEFIYGENKTGKKIVFGHTPTQLIHPDKSNEIWISPCKTKIAIDGAAVYGGFLHGIRVNEKDDNMEVFSV